MTKEEANAKLSELVTNAVKALSDAEEFATEHKLGFHWSPFYGGGGYFDGEIVGEYNHDMCCESDGWHASSQGC